MEIEVTFTVVLSFNSTNFIVFILRYMAPGVTLGGTEHPCEDYSIAEGRLIRVNLESTVVMFVKLCQLSMIR